MSSRTFRPTLADERSPYRGLMLEAFDYGRTTTSGPKNYAKIVYHALDWSKRLAQHLDTPLPPAAGSAGELAREFKRTFGILELPQAVYGVYTGVSALVQGPAQPLLNRDGYMINEAGRTLIGFERTNEEGQTVPSGESPVYLKSRLGLCHDAALKIAGVPAPLEDALIVLNGRKITAVAPETMKTLGRVAAGALLFSMVSGAIDDCGRIWEAVKMQADGPGGENWAEEYEARIRANVFGQSEEQIEAAETISDDRYIGSSAEMNQRMRMIIELNLIDLAMRISYIALASISLISAFIVTIPTASFWILVASTSALAFTIIGEFYGRTCRTLNPHYPQLPDLVERRSTQLRAAYIERANRFASNAHRAAMDATRLRLPNGAPLPDDVVDLPNTMDTVPTGDASDNEDNFPRADDYPQPTTPPPAVDVAAAPDPASPPESPTAAPTPAESGDPLIRDDT